ncbi:MAG: hypothetical protein FWE06_00985 [Oscillospiraceae bacterium]|nr:hypothetical protein [Oscillospiraceae bacterium]
MMNLPKRLLAEIEARRKAAIRWNSADIYITQWCKQKGIEIEYMSGCVGSICEPYAANHYTIEQIKEALNNEMR